MNDNKLAELLQELATFEPGMDKVGVAFSRGTDIEYMDTSEVLSELSFLRWWSGGVRILSIAEPRASGKALENAHLRNRLNILDDEMRARWHRNV